MRLRPAEGRVRVTIDGTAYDAAVGDSVAATLFAHGLAAQSTGADGAPRGAFCGMGVCHECLVTIDGRAGMRACLAKVADGMRIERFAPYRPKLAGLADLAAIPDGPLPRETVELAVIGAGPGGLTAACIAAEAGLDVTLLDERPSPGGQYYKQPATGAPQDVQGREGAALIARARAAGVRIRPGGLVWGAFRDADGAGELGILENDRASRLGFRFLVIAAGAYERPPPVPGWTLPGVMTTGACQTLLRAHGVAPGQRVLFAGNGPLNLQTAAELHRAGATVAAIADRAAPLSALAAGLAMAAASPSLTLTGLATIATLRAAGVPLLWRHILLRLEGDTQIRRAILAPLHPTGAIGPEIAIEADAVCLGDGFAPSAELARLLGCAHDIDESGLPRLRRGPDGATSHPDIFVVGEAGGFGGAQIARAQGALAGATIANRVGRPAPETGAARALARATRFQRALWTAFAAPPPPQPPPETIICRCESLTRAQLEQIARAESVADLATLKRLTRAGMGRCQGRSCAPELARILGTRATAEADLLAPQMPLRPVPLAAFAVEKPEWGGHRRALLPPLDAPDAEPLSNPEAGTIVVGAGVMGLATALYLARAGHDVMVIDAGFPNAMASGGNAGSLHVQLLSFDHGAKAEAGGSPAARTLPLQRDSVRLWQELAQETGRDFEIAITGGVMVAETERDLAFLEAKTERERAQGIDCHVIGAADLERLEPNLAPGLRGAAYCPEEGKINPLVATQGLLAAAIAAGARIHPRTLLRAVERDGATFVLTTNRGTLRTGRLVNAAGGFAARVGAMLGHTVPVFGAPLQMVVTEAAAPHVNGLIAHADRHLTLKQAHNGNFIIGGGWTATLDPVHQRPRPLRESLEGNLWVAQRVVPGLRRLRVLRSWAAMNINIDGAPILGEHPNEPGFFNTVSSNGYTLGPILGRITADLILRNTTDWNVSSFSISRFG